jgi:hypothetical protein
MIGHFRMLFPAQRQIQCFAIHQHDLWLGP